MKKKIIYIFSTFMLIGTSLLFNACGIEEAINDIIDDVKEQLQNRLSEQEQAIAEFDEYTPPVSEEYVGGTPYSGVGYNGISDEEQPAQPGGSVASVQDVGADMYVTADSELAVNEENIDLVYAPLSLVRSISMQKQLEKYNTGKAQDQNIYFDTDQQKYVRDGYDLTAAEEATVTSFLEKSIAEENFLVKRKVASLMQEHTQNVNGILFSYIFQDIMANEGSVPNTATVNINAALLTKFKPYYENAAGRPLPSLIPLVGGLYVPTRAINSGATIEVVLSDMVEYDVNAVMGKGHNTDGINYDIKISAKFTMTLDKGGAHETTFGGEDYIAVVAFKFDDADDTKITYFKFIFRSPMTNMFDYSEILVHDVQSGEFTNIRQYISPYVLDTSEDGSSDVQPGEPGDLSSYYASADYKQDASLGGYVFPVLNLFTAKFKKQGADNAFLASASFEVRGVKPLSDGIMFDETNNMLDDGHHPLLESLQVKGFIQEKAPAAVTVKQVVGENIYLDNNGQTSTYSFSGKVEISDGGDVKNFEDDGTAQVEPHKQSLREVDGDDEDVSFEENSKIGKDKEYTDMHEDYVLDEDENALHQKPEPGVHQGMDHPLQVYEKSPELYVYINANIEEGNYDKSGFKITRTNGDLQTLVAFKSVGVGTDDRSNLNFLVFILADNEPLPVLDELFTVTAEAESITVAGVKNPTAISISAQAQSLDKRLHDR